MAKLPEGISWKQVYGLGWLAGIGLTMSLFIIEFAFGDSPLLDCSNVGTLFGFVIAGVSGWFIFCTAKS